MLLGLRHRPAPAQHRDRMINKNISNPMKNKSNRQFDLAAEVGFFKADQADDRSL
jgi:hypothetical protein